MWHGTTSASRIRVGRLFARSTPRWDPRLQTVRSVALGWAGL